MKNILMIELQLTDNTFCSINLSNNVFEQVYFYLRSGVEKCYVLERLQ